MTRFIIIALLLLLASQSFAADSSTTFGSGNYLKGCTAGTEMIALGAAGGIGCRTASNTYTFITTDTSADSCTELCTSIGLTCVPSSLGCKVEGTDGGAATITTYACGTDMGGTGLTARCACAP